MIISKSQNFTVNLIFWYSAIPHLSVKNFLRQQPWNEKILSLITCFNVQMRKFYLIYHALMYMYLTNVDIDLPKMS